MNICVNRLVISICTVNISELAGREKKAPSAWCNMIQSCYIQLSYSPAKAMQIYPDYAKAFKQHNQLRLLASLLIQITPHVLLLAWYLINASKISYPFFSFVG